MVRDVDGGIGMRVAERRLPTVDSLPYSISYPGSGRLPTGRRTGGARPTYTGAIEKAEEFGKRIYVEAWKRGWSRAGTKVVMGDGADWIWNLADQHFPGAVQIVDLYHARQHLWDLARRLHPK